MTDLPGGGLSVYSFERREALEKNIATLLFCKRYSKIGLKYLHNLDLIKMTCSRCRKHIENVKHLLLGKDAVERGEIISICKKCKGKVQHSHDCDYCKTAKSKLLEVKQYPKDINKAISNTYLKEILNNMHKPIKERHEIIEPIPLIPVTEKGIKPYHDTLKSEKETILTGSQELKMRKTTVSRSLSDIENTSSLFDGLDVLGKEESAQEGNIESFEETSKVVLEKQGTGISNVKDVSSLNKTDFYQPEYQMGTTYTSYVKKTKSGTTGGITNVIHRRTAGENRDKTVVFEDADKESDDINPRMVSQRNAKLKESEPYSYPKSEYKKKVLKRSQSDSTLASSAIEKKVKEKGYYYFFQKKKVKPKDVHHASSAELLQQTRDNLSKQTNSKEKMGREKNKIKQEVEKNKLRKEQPIQANENEKQMKEDFNKLQEKDVNNKPDTEKEEKLTSNNEKQSSEEKHEQPKKTITKKEGQTKSTISKKDEQPNKTFTKKEEQPNKTFTKKEEQPNKSFAKKEEQTNIIKNVESPIVTKENTQQKLEIPRPTPAAKKEDKPKVEVDKTLVKETKKDKQPIEKKKLDENALNQRKEKTNPNDPFLKYFNTKQEQKLGKDLMPKISSTEVVSVVIEPSGKSKEHEIKHSLEEHHHLLEKHRFHKSDPQIDCPICQYSDLGLLADLYLENKKGKDKFKITEMVYEDKIVPKTLHSIVTEEDRNEEKPILFQAHHTVDEVSHPPLAVQFAAPEPVKAPSAAAPRGTSRANTSAPPKQLDAEANKGVLRYALSDRTFIEKGWTMLPTEKIVRKMNVYRMKPSRPEFDWFNNNKHRREVQYDSGETLARIDADGCGRWFYRNGDLALDYYNSEETNSRQRYVVYAKKTYDKQGKPKPAGVLATFDQLGNAVVFDSNGKIRMKYNQTEGVIMDPSLGPACRWKWHSLNDPPVLQQVMIDTQLPHKDPAVARLGPQERPRADQADMLAIEFDNFIKEKSKKTTQKFKPFQIRTKALKINEQFSLRVLDQATVYLQYRDGGTRLKLNLGMQLAPGEIIDTEVAEVGEVTTAFDRLPAREASAAELPAGSGPAGSAARARAERARPERGPAEPPAPQPLAAAPRLPPDLMWTHAALARAAAAPCPALAPGCQMSNSCTRVCDVSSFSRVCDE